MFRSQTLPGAELVASRQFPASGEQNWQLQLREHRELWWGDHPWQSFADLNRRMQLEYHRLGCISNSPHIAQYSTFFPVTESDGPHFTWLVIRREAGRPKLVLYYGDIAFCPFPNATDTRVVREVLRPGEELFLPADTCRAMEKFCAMGVVDLWYDPANKYTGKHFGGPRQKVEEMLVWELLPKHMRPQLEALAA